MSDGPITMDLSLKIAMEIFERNIHKIYITFVLIIKVFVIICSDLINILFKLILKFTC